MNIVLLNAICGNQGTFERRFRTFLLLCQLSSLLDQVSAVMTSAWFDPNRSQVWIWWVCCLLLLASTINYMDRQTLSNISVRITKEFELNNEQYGNLELAFGLAFAAGATIFGVIADRTSVRWLYPTVLLLWSAMGFATGMVPRRTSVSLLCRLFLGSVRSGSLALCLEDDSAIASSGDRQNARQQRSSAERYRHRGDSGPASHEVDADPSRTGSWRPAFASHRQRSALSGSSSG